MAYKETDPQTASMFAINSLAICKTMTAPYERFKLILQTQSMSKINVNYQNMKVSDYFKTAKSREGSRSFFRGNLTNILHSIPSIYLRIQLYLHLRSKFQNNENLTKSQFIFCELLISGVSATIPLLAFYPLEVIKIRLTTEIRLKKNEKIYAGIYDCFHKIYTAEGIRGLYRGLGISCIGAVSYLTMVTLTNN